MTIKVYENELEASTYGGSELKCQWFLDGQKYMVKMPDPIRQKNNKLSYMNNQFSEYIGCEIMKTLNLKTQDTMLIHLATVNGDEKIAVACKDFLAPDERVMEMKAVSLSTSLNKKYTTSIEDVYEMLSNLAEKGRIDCQESVEYFWDMFVGDTLIGNTDRHLGNWGFIKKGEEKQLNLAPIYDCGSSLHPLLDDSFVNRCLSSTTEMKNVAYNITSVYTLNNKRIFYHEIFKNPPEDLKQAVLRIVPKIDMKKITDIINDIDALEQYQKDFYIQSIAMRKEQILDKAYAKIVKELQKAESKQPAEIEEDLEEDIEI